MTWIKLDDTIGEHPRFADLSPQAFTLWVLGLCYSSRNRTDGVIPDAIIPRLSNVRNPRRYADELVAAGLWQRDDTDPTSTVIRNYLEHQRSREQIERETLSGRERKRRSRDRNSRRAADPVDVSRRDSGVTVPDGHAPVTPTETETETETEFYLRDVSQTEPLPAADRDTPRRRRIIAQVRGELARHPDHDRGAILADALTRIDDTLAEYPDAPDAVVVHALAHRDGRTLRHYRTRAAT